LDKVFLLAMVTFALVLAYLVWNRVSIGRKQSGQNPSSGIGGPNDPLAGTTEDMRDPDDMRQSLDRASSAPVPVRRQG
jgi:hypothetical protein